MKDATIQKPWIDTLFRGTKVAKLVCYLTLQFNTDLKHQEVSFGMFKYTFLKVKSQQLLL